MINHVLQYSLDTQMPINIIYQKGIEISQRQIQVRKIEGDIVHAYCHKKHAVRNFKKDNILAAVIPGTVKNSYGNSSIYI
ncbi:MAG: hypothetical protein ACOYVK_00570 [Bacillota bacterium]